MDSKRIYYLSYAITKVRDEILILVRNLWNFIKSSFLRIRTSFLPSSEKQIDCLSKPVDCLSKEIGVNLKDVESSEKETSEESKNVASLPLRKKIIIQCLKNCNQKYELNVKDYIEQKKINIILDRELTGEFRFPTYYCTFINSKIQEDGDFLDLFLISDRRLLRHQTFELKDIEILANISYNDKGQKDPKVIAKLKDEHLSKEYLQNEITKILDFLINYKSPIINIIQSITFPTALELDHSLFDTYEIRTLSKQEFNLSVLELLEK